MEKPSLYTPWFRFALLLTGNEPQALQLLRETLEEAAGQLAQFRSTDSKVTWLLRTLERKARVRDASAGKEGAPETSFAEGAPQAGERWAQVAMLPDAERTAFALFHSFPWSMEKIAEISGSRSKFGSFLDAARRRLAPEAYFPVEPVLHWHRPWGGDASRVAKAVKKALAGPDKARLPMEAQITFDEAWHEALGPVQVPENVELPDVMGEAAPSLGGMLRQPAVLAIGVAFLVVLGVVCFMALQKMEEFTGRETIDQIVQGLPLEKAELEPVNEVAAGTLEDWFLLKGFEGFSVPPELGSAKVKGCRVYRFEGQEVAHLALAEGKASVLVFRAGDLKVAPDAAVWTIYQLDGTAVAVKRDGVNCYVLTYQGDSKGMNDLLGRLAP